MLHQTDPGPAVEETTDAPAEETATNTDENGGGEAVAE